MYCNIHGKQINKLFVCLLLTWVHFISFHYASLHSISKVEKVNTFDTCLYSEARISARGATNPSLQDPTAFVPRTTTPTHRRGSAPCIPLLCAHATLWVSNTAQSCPQTAATANARRTARKSSSSENGKVSKGHLSFTLDRHINRGLDIRIDSVDSRLRIFLFSPDGDFSPFFFSFISLLDLSRFVSSRFGACLEPGFASVGVGRKCASPRSHALARAPSWCLRCFGLLSSVDAARTQGRAPLPARVLGILWTAVGWEGAKFQRRSRSGPSNCECY